MRKKILLTLALLATIALGGIVFESAAAAESNSNGSMMSARMSASPSSRRHWRRHYRRRHRRRAARRRSMRMKM